MINITQYIETEETVKCVHIQNITQCIKTEETVKCVHIQNMYINFPFFWWILFIFNELIL